MTNRPGGIHFRKGGFVQPSEVDIVEAVIVEEEESVVPKSKKRAKKEVVDAAKDTVDAEVLGEESAGERTEGEEPVGLFGGSTEGDG